jgi:hypothetical protein
VSEPQIVYLYKWTQNILLQSVRIFRASCWELLWLRHGNSSETQKKEICRWKLLPENWWRQSWLSRLSVCYSEMWTVLIHELLLLLVVMSCNIPVHLVTNPRPNSVASVRERNLPTERPPFIGEVSVTFFADRWVPRGKGDGSLRQYFRFHKPEQLLCLPDSSSIILMRLSGPRSRPITSQKIW